MAREAPVLPLLQSLALAPRALEAGLDESDLHLGVELARLVPEDEREGLVGLVAALRLAEREGSSRLPLDGRLRPFATALGLSETVHALATALLAAPERLAPVVGRADDFRPLLVEDGCLHAQRMLALERRLAQRLAALARRQGEPAVAVDAAVDAVLARPPLLDGRPLLLSDEQRAAVSAAASGGLTLISGGPGTGKTSIVVSILRTLVRLGVDPAAIALAAPTGKAADRMRVATEIALGRIAEPDAADDALSGLPRPQTLHRLLGFSPRDDGFRHDEHDPLAASVVLVDESSMVDLALADRLVRALPAGARLVLVGDAHQLPSVDAGAVFRDLCAAGEGVAVTLRHSYRMDASDPRGRSVLEAARAVDAGDAAAVLGTGTATVDAVRFEGFERLGATALEGFLGRWWDTFGAPLIAGAGAPLEAVGGRLTEKATEQARARFEQMDRARLLAPTRARREGVIALNDALHARACAARDLDPRRTFAYGEPLLVNRNDYERDLFNGDQGLVLPVRSERGVRPSAVFRTREGMVAFALDTVRGITELAWAVTVHKSQGSEHDAVALVLPSEPLPLTTRELVYTALTRARHGALVLGSEPVLRAAIESRAERFSGLRSRFEAARR